MVKKTPAPVGSFICELCDKSTQYRITIIDDKLEYKDVCAACYRESK